MGRRHIYPIVIVSVLGVWSVAHGQFNAFLVEESGGLQLYPEVEGAIVVWQEHSDGGWFVRAKNLGTGEVFTIDGPDTPEFEPVTNGSIIVWRDRRAGDFNLYAFDLQTGTQVTLVDEPHSQVKQAVGETYLVWTDARNSPPGVPSGYGNQDIFAMDLRTRQEFPVCTAPFDQIAPDISGNIIVWEDARRFNPFVLNPLVCDVYAFDLTTGKEFLIAAAPDGVGQAAPAISGDTVVWVDGHNGGDIMGYDIETGISFPIHVDSPDDYHGQTGPDVDGRYVVWEDYRNGTDADIWGYDLLTRREFPICVGPGSQQRPKISGDLVVWYNYTDEESRIMAAYIPEPASVGLLAFGGLALLRRRTVRGISTQRARGQ